MTELAAPPAVFLRQHLIVHGLSTSSRRPANSDYYRVSTGVPAMVNIATPAWRAPGVLAPGVGISRARWPGETGATISRVRRRPHRLLPRGVRLDRASRWHDCVL